MKKTSTYALAFCGICIALNIVLGIITSALGIPLYLDTLGTMLSAAVLGRLSRKLSRLAAPRTALVQYVASLDDLDAVIRGHELLEEHTFFLHNIRQDAKYTLSPEVEQAISLYEISGSSAWSDLQSYLTATVPVEYNGGTTTLSDIRNKAYDDRRTNNEKY